MALIPCKACGHQISSRAKSCPKCGSVAAAEPGVSIAPRKEPTPREKPQEQPQEPPSSAVLGKIEPVRLTLPADHESAPEEWFYRTGAGRVGPVRLSLLHALIAAGQIPADTQIWKPGLLDWVVISEYSEAEVAAEPDPEPQQESGPRKGLLWWVALAPVWGALIQIVATEVMVAVTHMKLSYYAQLWWITLFLNIAAAYGDYLRLGNGEERKGIERWCSLAVPFYIYRREQLLQGAGKTRLWVWVGSLLVSLATLEYLNNLYAKILAG